MMGQYKHPEVSLHNHSLAEYMHYIYLDDWDGVARLMLSSANKLKAAGADFLISPDNTIHQIFNRVKSLSPLPWLNIATEVTAEAAGNGFRKSAILGTKYLMTSQVYPEVYKKFKLKFMIPSLAVRDRINTIIFNELVYGVVSSESRPGL